MPTIGIIGALGSMGQMYSHRLSAAGYPLLLCDLPTRLSELETFCSGLPGATAVLDGHAVSRESDIVIYSVEAEYISSVVAQYGKSTKLGCIVSGQTSVKAPEIAAFERYLPADVQIVSLHSLHGPAVDTKDQPLIIIPHRATPEAVSTMREIFSSFKSRYITLSMEQHDVITANTQAVTHAAFLSMGTAWARSRLFPWESGRYVKGIEVVKTNLTMRIYSNKWHVYAGLAILNPYAQAQIEQFASSATEIFKLMLSQDIQALRERILTAKKAVFNLDRPPILLSDAILDKFSLGTPTATHDARNSHLSLLAMVDSWHILTIRPFDHLELAATPLFRLWIGVADCLFRDEARLEEAINAACFDTQHRADDTEFVIAARGWSETVAAADFGLYKRRFEQTAVFFEPRFESAKVKGAMMLEAVAQSQVFDGQLPGDQQVSG